MHLVERPQLPSMRENLRRDIDRAAELAGELDGSLRAAVLARLDNLPAGQAVCHGDYHPDNVILTPGGPLIIDWVTAGHGNPDADVARTVLLLRQGEPLAASAFLTRMIGMLRRLFLGGYLRTYRALRPCPDSAIDAWLPVIAAARLSEGIEVERSRLIALAGGSP
jgi:aminoglycoside phosphotransferase (APT) family kinase protein